MRCCPPCHKLHVARTPQKVNGDDEKGVLGWRKDIRQSILCRPAPLKEGGRAVADDGNASKNQDAVAGILRDRRHDLPTIAGASALAEQTFAQATGLVNDHLVGCFRHEECAKLAPKK